MKANKDYLNLGKEFWANIRTISQKVGYVIRGKNQIKVPTIQEIIDVYKASNLNHIFIYKDKSLTEFGKKIINYYEYRADLLNNKIEPLLMDVKEAKKEYHRLKKNYKPTRNQPMNKQKGEKKSRAFFTCIINMILENKLKKFPCDYDPRELTTITRDNFPLRTFSRRVDGAFPGVINPHSHMGNKRVLFYYNFWKSSCRWCL